MPKLILFDIDGTLLWSNGAGALALRRAMVEVYGTAGALEQIYLAGMTDRAIVQQALDDHNPQEIQAGWENFSLALARHMTQAVTERQVRACPGVLDLLSALHARQNVLLGLATGNLEITAPIKLRAAGIEPGPFRVGGYGSDDADRNKLPAIAAQRAEALTGARFAGHDIVIVGDTPADIACGKAVGARTVAVATGFPPPRVLQAAAPDALLPDLANLATALQTILAH
jgi:phosphoglycolate phosphatase-like HAD superfamily hydrolase